MNKKLLLIYILFFVSVNVMAAFESRDCAHLLNSDYSNKLQANQACTHVNANQHNLNQGEIQRSDKSINDGSTNVGFNNKESKSGALTFILLIPALLVFLFSGFKKSNK